VFELTLAGDLFFIAMRRYTCQRWAAEGVPAYCYRFNVIPAGIPYYIAATHFQEGLLYRLLILPFHF